MHLQHQLVLQMHQNLHDQNHLADLWRSLANCLVGGYCMPVTIALPAVESLLWVVGQINGMYVVLGLFLAACRLPPCPLQAIGLLAMAVLFSTKHVVSSRC